MNIKSFAFFLAISILFSQVGFSDELIHQESVSGNYLYLNPFAHKPATPAEHWDYATSLRARGKLKAALKQFDRLQKRWPESAQAAAAVQARGDIFFELGDDKQAFAAYEMLIKTYYTGLKNYDSILENQYAVALREMQRTRMPWLFGGYQVPERAIPYFESILKNAPQWERAAEIQYQIGVANQKDEQYRAAIDAYSAVEYRYPHSSFAERAARAKLRSLRALVEKTPYSADLREEAQLASALFVELYPQSPGREEADRFAAELAEQAAAHDLDVARFYERVPHPTRRESAQIYYQSVADQYADTHSARAASQRLRVLLSDTPRGASGAVADSGAQAIERAPLPERLVGDAEAVEVSADRLEYQGDFLIGEGDVSVQQKGASLQADSVRVNSKTGEITAMGNVVMLRDANRWEGEQLRYNYKTRVGSFRSSALYFEPAYITAEHSERISSNEYRMVNARLTTCSGEDPILYAKAREVRLVDEEAASGRFIQAKHVTFYIAGVPVFYTPYWHRHLGQRVFSFTVGYGGHLGAFVMARAALHPTDWLRSNTHLDAYSQRGVGLGQDFQWTTPGGSGSIKAYYIDDNDPYRDDDLTADELALIDSQRYRIHLDHREQLAEQTYFRTEINWLSDPNVLDDFFEEEFRRNANPENYAVVQHAGDELAAGVRIDRRANDFYTATDRMPEATFNWYRKPFGKHLYFQSDNRLGFYETQRAETNQLATAGVPNERAARFDSYNQWILPLRVHNFLNLIPRVAYRGTWYEDSPSSSALYRNLFESGIHSSFKAHRVLTQKSGFFGTGVRHVVEPYADYLYRYSNLQTNQLVSFDEIDEQINRNELRFGLRNVLQTKRGAKRVENLIDADLYAAYQFNRAPDETRWRRLGAEIECELSDRLRLDSDLEYDLRAGLVERYNARASYRANDLSRYWFEYRYWIETRSLFAVGSELFPSDDWSYRFLVRYDSTLNEWRDRQFLINHRFDCIGVGVGLKMDEDDEPSLWLNLWLNAFGPDSAAHRL